MDIRIKFNTESLVCFGFKQELRTFTRKKAHLLFQIQKFGTRKSMKSKLGCLCFH